MKGLRICYREEFIYFKKSKVSFKEAEDFLIENFPLFLLEYTVKKTVKGAQVLCHVDWQGVLGSSFFTLLIKEICKNTKPRGKK